MPLAEDGALAAGDPVRHAVHGDGEVIVDQGPVVFVRFGQDLKSVVRAELSVTLSLKQKLEGGLWDKPLEVIARTQAATIRSLNDEWGVFAASRIELLPHQLWVCRQVTGQWPTRWLIADDVGLGKTVEAGMILSSLMARGRVRRLLVLCPANLVGQWQQRMLRMFEIRLTQYATQIDTERGEFWRIHDAVVASFHTLRNNHRGRKDRILAAEPFDLVIVDEAHHLNDDEATGQTQAYRLLRDMQDGGRIESMAFFTGTPHRGKDYGFFSLLSLLRGDLFSPEGDRAAQMAHLPEVMIRNNKVNVTDLQGKRLFQPLNVQSEEYRYTPEEAHFYDRLTEFILSGQMYARSLSATNRTAVMLALIALQKLASSSVAAIRRALQRRLDRVTARAAAVADLKTRLQELEENDEMDAREELEAELHLGMMEVALAANEEPALRELLAAADAIPVETKIETLLDALDARFPGRSVLFFTEYKATQSLLLSALNGRYGEGSVAFINGEGRLTDVRPAAGASGPARTIEMRREDAAARFNRGTVRFLISTEAGGEGIDLQENCHTLIHVDLPWNPMRLHQRVGRVHRYGQKHRVDVLMLHNPDTVESRIWNLLNEKLERITAALGQVMDVPEDMTQLVLGMASPGAFGELFSEAIRHRHDSRGNLESWFDQKTASVGGRDVVSAVREMIGNASKFDFAQVSALIPQVDLSDLRPFVENALVLSGRRPSRTEDGHALSFRTPDDWRKGQPGIRVEYDYVAFDRGATLPDKGRLLGVGDPLLDTALTKMGERDVALALIPEALLPRPLFVFRVFSRETLDVGGPQPLYVGVETGRDAAEDRILSDGETLQRLNHLSVIRSSTKATDPTAPSGEGESRVSLLHRAQERIASALSVGRSEVPHRFRTPGFEPFAVFWPDASETKGTS